MTDTKERSAPWIGVVPEEKKIHIIDLTYGPPDPPWRRKQRKLLAPSPKPGPSEAPLEAQEKPPEPSEEKKAPPEPKRVWKRMTARKFILDVLVNNPISTEELAEKYIKEGHSTKPVEKVKGQMSATISALRKENYPIVKIKRGRYGIRR